MQILIAVLASLALQAPPAKTPSASAWQARRAEVEHCLVDAKVAKLEEVPIGVTKPSRAILQDTGCARAFAWKPLRPGMYSGYWESYTSEIAAYELDKLLGLNMVPVAVERRINGISGAAILWLDGVRSWEQILPLPKPPAWPMRLVRMKMFDCLVGNSDRNKGNMLVDEDWNLYLIDHSRAFVSERRLPPASIFQNVDRALWERMLALDEATLSQRLGELLDQRRIRAILQRRDAMEKHIDSLVATHGDKVFFVP
jgi:hypothetical protein